MPDKLLRNSEAYGPVTLTNDTTTSFRIPLSLTAGAVLQVVSLSSGSTATVNWYSGLAGSTAVFQLCDSANAPITTTIQGGRCYDVPGGLFASTYVIPALTTSVTASVYVTIKG